MNNHFWEFYYFVPSFTGRFQYLILFDASQHDLATATFIEDFLYCFIIAFIYDARTFIIDN